MRHRGNHVGRTVSVCGRSGTLPPGPLRAAAARLHATETRIRQALGIVERGVLAGVQQGGRFPDLRHESTSVLRDLGPRYLALGSLVPFLTRNHDIRFVCAVAANARRVIGPEVPSTSTAPGIRSSFRSWSLPG